MNTRENNEKNIKKLEQTAILFNDGENVKQQEEAEEQNTAVPEPPLMFARKLAVGVMLAFWVMAVVFMLGGGDFRAMLPFLLLSVAAVALLNIPVFLFKKKIADVIIAVVAGTLLISISISLLLI